jgi:acetoin utilization deacetylase AcuC-like enzyme
MRERVAIYSHPDCARHAMDHGHPECPERLEAVARGLASSVVAANLDWRIAPEVPEDALLRVHTPEYVGGLEAATPRAGLRWLDPDTALGPESLHAARRAAGAAVAATGAVLDGEIRRALCAVRPPGHHAGRERAMGFCFFNGVACAAAQALARGLSRVAILDFDVHHGNGTEEIFRDEPRVLFCSSFQHPFYPLTPLARRDHLVHVPLPAGCDGAAFRAALDRRWWPAIDAFRPELVLISAGFDGHADDRMAGLMLADDDFRWVTERIVAAAERHAAGRLVSVLEGGYDMGALARCVGLHVTALAGTGSGAE